MRLINNSDQFLLQIVTRSQTSSQTGNQTSDLISNPLNKDWASSAAFIDSEELHLE